MLGGDHAITWPSVAAVADHVGHGRVGIIHFDAHADTADEIDGNLASHGTPMRRLIESGAVWGRNFVQVGLRGYWPPADVVAWMREQEMRTHFMQEIWEDGIHAVMDRVIGEALDGPDLVYISCDIDVLDPGFAPAPARPSPEAWRRSTCSASYAGSRRRHQVIGMDVVEVAPAYDHADITVNNGHRVVWEVLSGMAARRRDSAGWARPGYGSMRRRLSLRFPPTASSGMTERMRATCGVASCAACAALSRQTS